MLAAYIKRQRLHEHEFARHRFWPCSGRFEVVVLCGMLSLVAQLVYWSRIVSGLNQEHAQILKHLRPETMTVSFEEFSPTNDFFDYTGLRMLAGSWCYEPPFSRSETALERLLLPCRPAFNHVLIRGASLKFPVLL